MMLEKGVKFVLLDIEGTTTSISFVKDVLFPYAKEHTKTYLREHWEDQTTQTLITDLIKLPQYAKITIESVANNDEETLINIVNFIHYLIEKDYKVGPLKTLQGNIWEKGYSDGDLKGHVYKDVPSALKRWHKAGIKIAIYSSGSVKAQQLLFEKTEYGNLLTLIVAHFDTAIGHKEEMASYLNISRILGEPCEDILFLTDVVKEAIAASASGMQTAILNRPGNAALSPDDFKKFNVINDFDELILQKC